MDGSFGYDHRKFKRVHRLIRQGKIPLATAIATEHLVTVLNHGDDVRYSPMQLKMREWAERNRRTWRRVLAPIPAPPIVKAPVMAVPEVVEMLSYGVGSGPGVDMYTPEVQRYEESVTWGGSGGIVI